MSNAQEARRARVIHWAKCLAAIDFARKTVREGDRLRVSKCPGTKRTMTFNYWDGADSCWMVSRSGIDDYHPVTIDKINGVSVDATMGWEQYMDKAAEQCKQADADRIKRRKNEGY